MKEGYEIADATLFGQPIRVLRKLKVDEGSAVPGARIMVAKRDDTMPDINKAFALWDSYTDMLAAHGLTKMEAINAALKNPLGQQLFQLAKLSKMKPDSSAGDRSRQETGAVYYPPAENMDHSGADQTGVRVPGAVSGASELARLRAAQVDKLVGDYMRANPGSNRDRAVAAVGKTDQGKRALADWHRAEHAAKFH